MYDRAHIDFLTSDATLRKQAGLTLQERTYLFEQQFPDKKLCVTTLRRIYRRAHVKRKAVNQEKKASSSAAAIPQNPKTP